MSGNTTIEVGDVAFTLATPDNEWAGLYYDWDDREAWCLRFACPGCGAQGFHVTRVSPRLRAVLGEELPRFLADRAGRAMLYRHEEHDRYWPDCPEAVRRRGQG